MFAVKVLLTGAGDGSLDHLPDGSWWGWEKVASALAGVKRALLAGINLVPFQRSFLRIPSRSLGDSRSIHQWDPRVAGARSVRHVGRHEEQDGEPLLHLADRRRLIHLGLLPERELPLKCVNVRPSLASLTPPRIPRHGTSALTPTTTPTDSGPS